MKKVVFLLVLVLAAAAIAWKVFLGGGEKPISFRFAKVEKGEILVTVNTTGTVQPVTQVQVGTQVSGTISKLHADYNDRVKAGQVLAEIDPAPFQARVDQDRANLARAEADQERAKVLLEQAKREMERSKELADKKLISDSEFDTAVSNYKSLEAQQKIAAAVVSQARSTLKMSEVNLGYTTIASPIDGVVVSRNVDVGQTVAASLSAPTIFVIADNLARIRILASVPEADIARIEAGQGVAFTVDAFKDTTLRGKVEQVRLEPTTQQNVVTYTVVISADNPSTKLLPGMTADVTFEIERFSDILKVPNAALRYTPPETAVLVEPAPPDEGEPRKGEGEPRPEAEGKGDAKNGAAKSDVKNGGPRPAGETRKGLRDRKGGGERKGGGKAWSTVWVPSASLARAVRVRTGATDGSFTQVLAGRLEADQDVIVGIALEGAAAAPAMKNPFLPTPGKGRSGGGRPH